MFSLLLVIPLVGGWDCVATMGDALLQGCVSLLRTHPFIFYAEEG
nr:MAG TPA: hypothetical protein [Caudoviricetes sp.]